MKGVVPQDSSALISLSSPRFSASVTHSSSLLQLSSNLYEIGNEFAKVGACYYVCVVDFL